jgi:predicted Fe-Mo cluster-binding NifX family protein
VSTHLGIPVWEDQVSTTLDFARTLLVVEVAGGREVSRQEAQLGNMPVERKARLIRDRGVGIVLCGAVSEPLARAVCRAGIQLIPHVSGRVDDVVAAYLRGQLAEPRFLQPGCGPAARRRWRRRGGFRGQC